MKTTTPSLFTRRISLSLFFFFYGLSYASWASRIPTIQQNLHLSETQLGTVLLGMPVGSFLTLPLSGFLVSKIGSRKVIMFASILYSCMLAGIGFSQNIFQLSASLFLFGSFGNMMNISINTQAINLEEMYGKRIISSFHGVWSVAGLGGAFLGSYLLGRSFAVHWHFLIIACIAFIAFVVSTVNLIHDKPSHQKKKAFTLPDKAFLSLGLIAFCSMMCQGAMFDWSGVYFKKVVQADREWIGAGYTAFMIAMTATRFITDWLTHHIGFKKIIIWCGIFTAIGLIIAVALPYVFTATLGLLLIGIGVSPTVPLVFSAAGKSKELSPGVAIAAVSTLGFVGLLIGPPMIGFVAGATTLKISFVILSLFGATVSILGLFTKQK